MTVYIWTSGEWLTIVFKLSLIKKSTNLLKQIRFFRCFCWFFQIKLVFCFRVIVYIGIGAPQQINAKKDVKYAFVSHFSKFNWHFHWQQTSQSMTDRIWIRQIFVIGKQINVFHLCYLLFSLTLSLLSSSLSLFMVLLMQYLLMIYSNQFFTYSQCKRFKFLDKTEK